MTQVGSGSERRLALVVEYDGTCYQGFQLQHQRPTIQGEIEQALKRFTQVDIIRHAQQIRLGLEGNFPDGLRKKRISHKQRRGR